MVMSLALASISALLVGILEAGVLVVILLLVGLIVELILGALGVGVTPQMRRLYLILVALIFLICVVLLLFGLGPLFVLR